MDFEDSSLQQMQMVCGHKFHRPKTKTPAECEEKLNRQWQETVQALLAEKSSGNLSMAAVLYFQVALKFYEMGKPEFKTFLRKSALANLVFHRGMDGVKKVQLRTDSCCDECSRHRGGRILLEEAIRNISLPIATCTNKIGPTGPGWCVCEHLPVFD